MKCIGFVLKDFKVKDTKYPDIEQFDYNVLLPYMILDNGEEIPMQRVESFSIKAGAYGDRGKPRLELVLNQIDIDPDFVIKKGCIFYKDEKVEFDMNEKVESRKG